MHIINWFHFHSSAASPIISKFRLSVTNIPVCLPASTISLEKQLLSQVNSLRTDTHHLTIKSIFLVLRRDGKQNHKVHFIIQIKF